VSIISAHSHASQSGGAAAILAVADDKDASHPVAIVAEATQILGQLWIVLGLHLAVSGKVRLSGFARMQPIGKPLAA